MLERTVDTPRFSSEAARRLVRLGLANYFSAALILPYTRFLEAAEQLHYDIDLLGQRFGVSFETICHRLSTMQRPEAAGVPFFFIRVDRDGNISKRQSAAHFHFSRVWRLSALECLRSLFKPWSNSEATGADAGWTGLLMDCAYRVSPGRRFRPAWEGVRSCIGVLRGTCASPCVCPGLGYQKSRQCDTHRDGMSGMRAYTMRSARFSVYRPRTECRRKCEQFISLSDDSYICIK